MEIIEICLGQYAHGIVTPNPRGTGTLLGCCWHNFLELRKDGKTVFIKEERCDEPDPDKFMEELEEKFGELEEEGNEKLSFAYESKELEWHDLGDVYHKGLQQSVKTINNVNTTHFKATVITYYLP